MNIETIEQLLNESESPTLDFKRDQYPFVGATNEQKSELLKDILAFANAWRRTDAYILIGVDEQRGKRAKVVGITEHLEEANLQQFVNSKTNKPIDFSYEEVIFEGKQLGIIKILLQERPFFIKNNFGKLKKGIVYVRRGSSCDKANPDEIASMGEAKIEGKLTPMLTLEFGIRATQKTIGQNIRLESNVYLLPEASVIPQINMSTYIGRYGITIPPDPDYYREFASYIRQVGILKPVSFAIKNLSGTLAVNTIIDINKTKEEGLFISQYSPSPPKYHRFPTARDIDTSEFLKNISVNDRKEHWQILAETGNIQPKATAWSDPFYIGGNRNFSFELEAKIYADNLATPLNVPLSMTIETQEQSMNLEELIKIADSKA